MASEWRDDEALSRLRSLAEAISEAEEIPVYYIQSELIELGIKHDRYSNLFRDFLDAGYELIHQIEELEEAIPGVD